MALKFQKQRCAQTHTHIHCPLPSLWWRLFTLSSSVDVLKRQKTVCFIQAGSDEANYNLKTINEGKKNNKKRTWERSALYIHRHASFWPCKKALHTQNDKNPLHIHSSFALWNQRLMRGWNVRVRTSVADSTWYVTSQTQIRDLTRVLFMDMQLLINFYWEFPVCLLICVPDCTAVKPSTRQQLGLSTAHISQNPHSGEHVGRNIHCVIITSAIVLTTSCLNQGCQG